MFGASRHLGALATGRPRTPPAMYPQAVALTLAEGPCLWTGRWQDAEGVPGSALRAPSLPLMLEYSALWGPGPENPSPSPARRLPKVLSPCAHISCWSGCAGV